MKKKLVFLGDINSINIELIQKSHHYLKNKVKYILLGNRKDLSNYLNKLSSNLDINDITNPLNFENYKKESLNIFDIENIHKEKYQNLLNQIRISNHLANLLKIDLVTLPINKSLFKKRMKFNGMTEYLAILNKKKTVMLMHGEKFSIIPLTTHINLKDVSFFLKTNFIKKELKVIQNFIKKADYNLNFKKIKFLCYNPHCGEDNTIGHEDDIIKKSIHSFNKISGPYSADSAFKKIDKSSLFISMYHDQALIPFKILNNKGINITMGLKYRRISPAHGTAYDIKFKNKADNTSFVSCMKF